MGNRRISSVVQFVNINDIYIKFGVFILNYFQNELISVMKNNINLALIKRPDTCW